jgi:hypothetical protein
LTEVLSASKQGGGAAVAPLGKVRLVVGVIDTVKDVATLVQKFDNMDLIKRMIELQQQVHELVTENLQTKEENRIFKEKLTTREQLVFKKNAYWHGEDGPFCSRCFDADGLVLRMHVRSGYEPQCPKCKTCAVDPDRQPPKPARRSGSAYLSRGGY